jgi:sugar O-acyltransferase (sialic acid O-acetyltransferase NeuD family)
MIKTVIYGNASMARVLYSYAKHSMDICGFTVDDNCIQDKFNEFCGLPLVPFSKVQDVFNPGICKMIIAIGFIDMNDLRKKKYQEAKKKGYSFASYIDNTVGLHEGVCIDENCVILDFVSIHPDTKIGAGTFISSNVNIGHTCTIESYNWISSGVSIAGGCFVGDGCFFGVNSSLANGVRIGKHNFVGANTLINKDTNDDEVYISEAGQLSRLSSKFFLKFNKILD